MTPDPVQRFHRFWRQATGCDGPYPYQERIALEEEFHTLVNIPTGLGKTAAIILGWIWRRLVAKEPMPRRLVYCLPMRVLVEQTRECARKWIQNLRQANGLDCDIDVHVLIGGEEADDWDLYPEKEAILIGTQDMLLSRALNRGYAMSRYRWPMQFGLLNNDCLWVFDEVQLMDVGVATSAQMEAFHRNFGMVCPSQSVWMSATLTPNWLNTVDFEPEWLGEPLTLNNNDKLLKPVQDRYEATKPINKATATIGNFTSIAAEIGNAHQPGSLTLAVFNTVVRAQQVYVQLKETNPSARVVLIHSRFRAADREEAMQQILDESPSEGTIALATQVVEAGVDVSAKVLFTELAPWASLVQRFGRCNRRGEFNVTKDAQISWFDILEGELENQAAPYEPADVAEARRHLQAINDAGPAFLEGVEASMALEPAHVIRRRDLVDLFDTTPDLAGNDIDISRFIRSDEELDVQVFWRDVPKDAKSFNPEQECGKAPRREELCPVPVFGKSGFREFAKKQKGNVWRWVPLERKWSAASENDVYPGQTFLVRSDAGGYDSAIGWSPSSKKKVDSIESSREELESYDREQQVGSPWQTVAQHTDDVVGQMSMLVDQLPLDDEQKGLLLAAARWHDRGKVHEVFQSAIFDGRPRRDGDVEPERPDEWRSRRDIGKAPDKSVINFWGRYERTHFRHELASALAMLAIDMDDLVIYLTAAHHGKVRLSIRSLPGEKASLGNLTRLYARGVWDGDQLPAADLGGGVTAPSVKLSLQCMQLGRCDNGQPSWAERMLKLRDDPKLGPFRLAYLEALLRAADMRASRFAAQHTAEQQEAAP